MVVGGEIVEAAAGPAVLVIVILGKSSQSGISLNPLNPSLSPAISKKLLSCLTKFKVEAGIYEGSEDGCPLGASTNVQGRFSSPIITKLFSVLFFFAKVRGFSLVS